MGVRVLTFLALTVAVCSCQFPTLGDAPPEGSPLFWKRLTLPSVTFQDLAVNLPGEASGVSRGTFAIRAGIGGASGPAGPVLQSGVGALRVRGRSSAGWPKRSLGLELRDPVAPLASFDLPLAGFPRANDFVLHSLWSDKSLARNFLAYRLGAETMARAPRCRFVELWGSQLYPDSQDSSVLADPGPTYQGLYLLVEKVRLGKDRVDAPGGYLFQIDWADDDTWAPPGLKTLNLVVKSPSSALLSGAQKTEVTGFLQGLEGALRSTPVGNWRAWLDEGSFVDYLLLNEVTKNVDAYRLSTYMNLPAGGKLRAGPVWDFDLGMGNDGRSVAADGWVLLGQLDPGFNDQHPAFWWNELLHDSEFRKALRDRWTQLRGGPFSDSSLAAIVNEAVDRTAPGRDRNFQRWPSLTLNDDTWWTPMPIPGSLADGNAYTYEDHLDYLRRWLRSRTAWMDSPAAWQLLEDWSGTMAIHIDQGGNL